TTTTTGPSTTTTTGPSTTTTTAPTLVSPVLGSFSEVLTATYGDASFDVSAPASTSSGSWSYASSRPEVAEVSAAGSVTLVGAGSTTLTLSQEATSTHQAASIDITLNVAKAAPVFDAIALDSVTYGAVPPAAPSPEINSPGDISYSISGANAVNGQPVATIDPVTGQIGILNSGTATVRISVAETANFLAGYVDVDFEVAKATPVVVANALIGYHGMAGVAFDGLPEVSGIADPTWSFADAVGVSVDSSGLYTAAEGEGVVSASVTLMLLESANHTALELISTPVKLCEAPANAGDLRCVESHHASGDTVLSWEPPITPPASEILSVRGRSGAVTESTPVANRSLTLAVDDPARVTLEMVDTTGSVLSTVVSTPAYEIDAIVFGDKTIDDESTVLAGPHPSGGFVTATATTEPSRIIRATVRRVHDDGTAAWSTDLRVEGEGETSPVFDIYGIDASDAGTLLVARLKGTLYVGDHVIPETTASSHVALAALFSSNGTLAATAEFQALRADNPDQFVPRIVESVPIGLHNSVGADYVIGIVSRYPVTVPAAQTTSGSEIVGTTKGWATTLLGLDDNLKVTRSFWIPGGDRQVFNDVALGSDGAIYAIGETRSPTQNHIGVNWPGSTADFYMRSDDWAGILLRLDDLNGVWTKQWAVRPIENPDKSGCRSVAVLTSTDGDDHLYASCYFRWFSTATVIGFGDRTTFSDSIRTIGLNRTGTDMNNHVLSVFAADGELLAAKTTTSHQNNVGNFEAPDVAVGSGGVAIAQRSNESPKVTTVHHYTYTPPSSGGTGTLTATWSKAFGSDASPFYFGRLIASGAKYGVIGRFKGSPDVDTYGDGVITSQNRHDGAIVFLDSGGSSIR
ncbi:MAG: hypothetical protein ACO3HT_10925, partial [Ilumatobacteraceae bacterium]